MDLNEHLQTTSGALKHWLVAQLLDSLAAALLWFVGLWILHVPWAALWAIVAGVFHFVPHFGPLLALIGPAVAAAVSSGWERLLYVLILYAIIAVIEGLIVQPYFLHRTARVPFWASLLTPIVLGLFLSFWGVLLAAPLLAIIYAYRAKARSPGELAATRNG